MPHHPGDLRGRTPAIRRMLFRLLARAVGADFVFITEE